MKAFSRQYWPTIALFVALLVDWQMAVSFGGIREYLLPSPLSVWNALWHGDIAWGQHLWTTTWEIIGAFVMAAVRARFHIRDVIEQSPDDAFAQRFGRAAKYVDWPMLVVMSLAKE